MFCYLEKIELSVAYCPVPCMYRNSNRQCAYQDLTPDTDETNAELSVTAQTISEIKGIKLYKVKSETVRAKLQVKIGLAILRYSEYLQDRRVVDVSSEIRDFLAYKRGTEDSTPAGSSLPRSRPDLNGKGDQGSDHEKIQELLLHRFGLTIEHQTMFFDPTVFKEWKATLPKDSSAASDSLTLSVFIEALRLVVSSTPTQV